MKRSACSPCGPERNMYLDQTESAAAVIDGFLEKMLALYKREAEHAGGPDRLTLMRWNGEGARTIADGFTASPEWKKAGADDQQDFVCFLMQEDGTWLANTTPPERRFVPFAKLLSKQTDAMDPAHLVSLDTKGLHDLISGAASHQRRVALLISLIGAVTLDPALLQLTFRLYREGLRFYTGSNRVTQLAFSLEADAVFGVQKLSYALGTLDQQDGPRFSGAARACNGLLSVRSEYAEPAGQGGRMTSAPIWPKPVEDLSPAELEVGQLGAVLDRILREAEN